MAIGLTPSYSEEIVLNEFTEEQFLILAFETILKLEWAINYVSRKGLIAISSKHAFRKESEIKINIENGVARISSSSTGSEFADWGVNKKRVLDFKENLEIAKLALTHEELEQKYKELMVVIREEDNDDELLKTETAKEEAKGFLSLFLPSKGYSITPILLYLNVVIFILMVVTGVNIMLPDTDSLVLWGANYKPITLDGEWWRLLTCCFIHIGMLHLLLNMYALLYIGSLLEPLLGRTRYLTAYILAGITASVTSLWWNDLTVSAGASGAIFGMYGVFLALLTTNVIEKRARERLLASIGIFVVYNLVFGMKAGIDNAAHIGGLLSGVAIGYAMLLSLKKPGDNKRKVNTVVGLSGLTATLVIFVYNYLPKDVIVYDKKIKEFSAREMKAQAITTLTDDTPEDKVIAVLDSIVIMNWKQNVEAMDSLTSLDLPDELKQRVKLLKEFSELRLERYELSRKGIIENTNMYNAEIHILDQAAGDVIKDLQKL